MRIPQNFTEKSITLIIMIIKIQQFFYIKIFKYYLLKKINYV